MTSSKVCEIKVCEIKMRQNRPIHTTLLYRLPQREIEKLQHVQNTAARIVTRSNRREHITPILKELHWLPIQSRIQFKLGLIVFKALNNLAPSYLQDLLKIHQPSRCLRSASKNLLQEPWKITKTYGDRTFRKAGSAIWNSLPDELRLETYLLIFLKINLRLLFLTKLTVSS